ncbi:MAG: hypothetical protein IE931_04905 [Sphingobacteriales bacterium]|nr:hypothetical protein [Sphingobacteriales bacterium]
MKKFCLALLFLAIPFELFCQQISLTHSGTLYDATENPVQASFQKDLSRKYQINILPAFDFYLLFTGKSDNALKNLIFNKTLHGSNFPSLGNGETNKIYSKSTVNLFNLRIFKTVNYNRELGFSLQFKNDLKGYVTDETLALLDTYQNFNQSFYDNVLNSRGYNQSYWQLSVNYREDYDKKWAFGGKFSLLNGATYSKININSSNLEILSPESFQTKLVGNYTSSFGTDSFTYKKLLPNLRNMGLAISGGVSYTSKKNIYITLNIKDLGFIHWSKNSSYYQFNDTVKVSSNSTNSTSSQYFSSFRNIINVNQKHKRFNTVIDTKIDLAASKNFGFYKPIFIFSKSVFRPDGQIALLNNFRKNAFLISLNPIYDFNTSWNLGSQILIQSANAEFYLGSESLFPSYYFAKGYLTKNQNIGSGKPIGSIYLGLNVKFGRKMQTIGNADEIRGLNDKETGYVVRLSKKERRALQKKDKQTDKRSRKNNRRNH